MNTRTLVATFADYSTARQAARDLENLGISEDAISVDSFQKTAGAGSTLHQNEEPHESGFVAWWNSLFNSDDENQRREYDDERRGYEGALATGNAILRASVPIEKLDAAVDVLNRSGAVDVDRRSGSSNTKDKRPLMTNEAGTNDSRVSGTRTSDQGPIQVIEEELQVGKRAVQRGGVRVYSHVVDQPVEQQVRLREEHVRVERRPVNREVNPADIEGLRDQTIEVTEMVEEPVIGKRARVTEEVVVGKEATERTETVRDSIRRTEVNVEQLGGDARRGADASRGTQPADDYLSDYRRNYEETYGSASGFDAMRPAYEYGYRNANDARYSGRSWDQVENDLRTDYERNYPDSKWEQAKASVRYGWEKVTGKR